MFGRFFFFEKRRFFLEFALFLDSENALGFDLAWVSILVGFRFSFCHFGAKKLRPLSLGSGSQARETRAKTHGFDKGIQ